MSGHSKFANIKHKKEKNDAAKGKIFTIIGREIAVAVKEGGPDPSNNFKLAQVIAKAKSNNMPKNYRNTPPNPLIFLAKTTKAANLVPKCGCNALCLIWNEINFSPP